MDKDILTVYLPTQIFRQGIYSTHLKKYSRKAAAESYKRALLTIQNLSYRELKAATGAFAQTAR